MTTISHTGSTDESAAALAGDIRSELDRLESVDRETAGYLNSLACILQRVARADNRICDDEVAQMEQTLIDHAGITPAQAVLTVEIAKHRWQLSDAGCYYRSTRELRNRLDRSSRRQLEGFLRSVAEADGVVHPAEKAEIRQIAAELGIL